MNFLISGVAGFLGAALANHLVQQGHHVRGIDDLSTGDPQALLPDVHFTRGDVRDRPKLWTLLQDIDCVVHLAARVSVSESILYPSDYNDVNVGGTVSLMEAMRDVGIRRVILALLGRFMDLRKSSQSKKEVLFARIRLMLYLNWQLSTMLILLVCCGELRQYVCAYLTLMGRDNICLHLTRLLYPTFYAKLFEKERS
jgi:hypothetical protein